MNAFYAQVRDFCLMMQDEVAVRWETMPETPTSARTALAFSEKVLLCPTTESARACIQQDFEGALSFVVAMQGVSERIEQGAFRLPTEWPQYQTRFYVLGCTVQDYIDSLRQETAA